MNELRFSKAALNALAPQQDGKRACYYDDKARGLCVLVAATTKAFYVLRKVRGKTERVYVGRYPDTTIEEARKRAGRINTQYRELSLASFNHDFTEIEVKFRRGVRRNKNNVLRGLFSNG